METQNVFLGATGDIVSTYDNSGVVQPGSSKAPVDTSAIDPNTGVVITPDEKKDHEDKPNTSNNWIMYLGVGIMAYVLLFKKK
jgi:hypothetical protein